MPSLPPCPDEPDEEVLSTRAAAEAHRMVKLCHLAGIVIFRETLWSWAHLR